LALADDIKNPGISQFRDVSVQRCLGYVRQPFCDFSCRHFATGRREHDA
jgi:hypothetical protein